jgi:anti-sigma B factor antagonist
VADSYKIDQERAVGGTATLLRITGELDLTAREELCDSILAALADGNVIIDLDAVTFLDSEALGALIAGYNAARRRAAGYRVVNARGQVARVLTISGALDLFGP